MKKKTEQNENKKEGNEETIEQTYQQPETDDKNDEMDILKQKCDEYLLLAQRVQADFDNYRKRTACIRADAETDGVILTIAAILPSIDNLERAFTSEVNSRKENDSLLEGVKLILKHLNDSLSLLGVKEIPAKDASFNPDYHEAVIQVPAPEGQQSGMIAEVFKKGYLYKDKIIRHSMVSVTI